MKVYHIPPCPAYDVAGMESWLSDMAAKGLMLTNDGFFAGVAAFERGEPQRARYRLDAKQNGGGFLSDDYEPDKEAVETGKALGWQYVALRGDFYIYRSLDEKERELNTDPAVEALALRAVTKRRRDAVIMSFFWLIIYPLLHLLRGGALLTMVNLRTWFFAFGVALLIWLFVSSLRAAIHLSALRRQLISNGSIERGKKNTAIFYISRAVKAALIILWLCLFISRWSADVTDRDKLPLSMYSGNPPFATIADLAPDSDISYRLSKLDFTNMFSQWQDILAPVNWHWSENAALDSGGREVLSGDLYVDYHEFISAELARTAALEYFRIDKRSRYFQILDAPLPDADYAVIYTSDFFTTLVVQIGTRVVHASFYQGGEDKLLSPGDWAALMADSIRTP